MTRWRDITYSTSSVLQGTRKSRHYRPPQAFQTASLLLTTICKEGITISGRHSQPTTHVLFPVLEHAIALSGLPLWHRSRSRYACTHLKEVCGMSSSDPPPPAKLSFGFSKHQTLRRLDGGKGKKEESRQEITAIEGGVLRTASGQPVNAAAESKQYIVPKLENTFQTGVGNREKAKKFTPSFKPPDSSAQAIGDNSERFEAAKEDTRPKIVEYGLEKRERPDAASKGGEGSQQQGAQNGGAGEHGKGGHVPPAKLEEAALERDVQGLPEEAPVEVRGGERWRVV
eukprot:1155904-Pelagomonas_calceolata.AAC.1